jgi:hypothetical protein
MFKKRKGFRFIELPDGKFQFSWSTNGTLIMYAEDGKRIDITYDDWGKIKNSNEYMLTPKTWHGKHKKDACFGGWGKREVREAYRKYKVLQANKLNEK